MLKHWRDMKAQHPHSILFYRVGDFYEMFHEDATLAARILDITLTSRGDGVPLAGVPVKAAAEYLRQLVAAGHRVAICEQVEDPRLAKGLVRREVVETVTPGALLAEGWIPGARNNWMAALARPQRGGLGLAAVDLSTGEFLLETVPADGLEEALTRLNPAEVVVAEDDQAACLRAGVAAPHPRAARGSSIPSLRATISPGGSTSRRSTDSASVPTTRRPWRPRARCSATWASSSPAGCRTWRGPRCAASGQHLWLDDMTRRNLELVEPLRAGARGATLLEVLDCTLTPMGGRLLRGWLLSPLQEPGEIERRLDAVETAVRDARGRARLREALDGVRDLERLGEPRRRRPRHASRARRAARLVPAPARRRRSAGRPGRLVAPDGRRAAVLGEAVEELDLLADLAAELGAALEDRPPPTLADGGVIRAGLRRGSWTSFARCATAGASTSPRCSSGSGTGPASRSLKVGFNKVFGYYLEITNAHAARVPPDYERAADAGLGRAIRHARSSRSTRPRSSAPRSGWPPARPSCSARSARPSAAAIERIQRTARVLARLDVWAALAEGAVAAPYVRPDGARGFDLVLKGSRHPVIERMMPRESFIPNDVRFTEAERVLLVTGPNMAGKSTILRQIGLCVVLAQIGRLRARGGRVDRRGGPALHPRGRERQPGPRPVHLHGGDERDQRDPAQRRPTGAWSCWTRSAAAPRPTTAWRSPGR